MVQAGKGSSPDDPKADMRVEVVEEGVEVRGHLQQRQPPPPPQQQQPAAPEICLSWLRMYAAAADCSADACLLQEARILAHGCPPAVLHCGRGEVGHCSCSRY
jgi:hypothetical protein